MGIKKFLIKKYRSLIGAQQDTFLTFPSIIWFETFTNGRTITGTSEGDASLIRCALINQCADKIYWIDGGCFSTAEHDAMTLTERQEALDQQIASMALEFASADSGLAHQIIIQHVRGLSLATLYGSPLFQRATSMGATLFIEREAGDEILTAAANFHIRHSKCNDVSDLWITEQKNQRHQSYICTLPIHDPDDVENPYIMSVGINAPETFREYLLQHAGRFDQNESVMRKHLADFCQALGYECIIDAIKGHALESAWLPNSGGIDAHLKWFGTTGKGTHTRETTS